MDADFVDMLRRSVLERSSVQFMYGKHMRHVSPHVLGVTKDKRFVIHGFQWGGGSSQGAIDPSTGAWRFFYVDEIASGGPMAHAPWYPANLNKTEGDYKPPAFITVVLAVAP